MGALPSSVEDNTRSGSCQRIQSRSRCEHVTALSTDHKAVVIDLNNSAIVRGPGYWRFNNSDLKDITFVQSMNVMLENLINDENVVPSAEYMEQWELCKIEIMDFCIQYGKIMACRRKNEELNFHAQLKDIERQLIHDSYKPILHNNIYVRCYEKLRSTSHGESKRGSSKSPN